MMKNLIILLLPLLFCNFKTTKTLKTQPNIIVIMADDLGFGDLGCFGSKIIKTPHLDKLATEGVRLTQFYSGNTICAPSRCAFLTGKHTGNAYIRGNGDIPLRPQDTTITELLKQAGYQTALFGKWGMGDINTEGSPERKGWDRFLGFLYHSEAHYQQPSIAWYFNPESPQVKRTHINKYACDAFTDNAVAFLKQQNGQKPFFLNLSLSIPHAELNVVKESLKQYQDDKGNSIFEEKPFIGSHYGGQPMPRAAYAAMVSRADEYVGRIMEVLTVNGLDKNTLVIFTSDNGTHIEGGRTKEDVAFMASSGKWRGIKRDMYEGGIRVPTIVWGLDLPKGVERDGQGAFWDLLPTFAELAGVKKLPQTDGFPLWNYWQTGTNPLQRPLYWETFENGYWQAVRNGDWKYIHIQPRTGKERIELYDLKNDPTESHNLANENPKKLEEMKILGEKLRSKAAHPNFRHAGE
jgi:arylsulfatase A